MNETHFTSESADLYFTIASEAVDAHNQLTKAEQNYAEVLRLGGIHSLGDAAIEGFVNDLQSSKARFAFAEKRMPDREEREINPFAFEQNTQRPENHEELTMSAEAKTFVDSQEPMSAQEQLGFMSTFWEKLGHSMPQPSEDQLTAIEAAIEADPSKRVVISPLLDLKGRHALAQATKDAFPDNEFHETNSPLWSPDTSWTYGELLEDMDSMVNVGTEEDPDYRMLLYKTAGGHLVSRALFTQSLLTDDNSTGIAGESNSVWNIAVIDTAETSTDRSPETRADDIHSELNHFDTPEMELTVRMLHQINGEPGDTLQVNIVNEAIYKVDKDGNALREDDDKVLPPSHVAGVVWDPHLRQADLSSWSGGNSRGVLGRRRGAESEIDS